jgi:hypothetical protein
VTTQNDANIDSAEIELIVSVVCGPESTVINTVSDFGDVTHHSELGSEAIFEG